MGLNDFLDNDYTTNNNSKELVRVDEGQLIISKQVQEKLINFELVKKAIDKQEKEMKAKLYEIMKENGITKYESNDKKIMITLGEDKEDTEEEQIVVDELEFIKNEKEIRELYMNARKKYEKTEKVVVKGKKGSLRITIREKGE